MDQLSPGAQKVIAPETPMTQHDLDELRGGTRDNMMGEQFTHMDAARFDMEGRGLYSAQPMLNPEQIAPVQEQQTFQQPELPPPTPQQNWQHLYGQSENEKGQWRTLAQQQADQLLLLQQQVQHIQSSAVPQSGVGGGYSPAQPAYDPNFDPFPERPNSELMNWGEMKAILRDEILPTMDLRARQAQDIATARAQRLMPQWDVSNQEEMQVLATLRSRFAGLDNRFTATEVNSMVQDQVQLLRASRAGQQQLGTVQAPTATPVGRVGWTTATGVQPTPPPPQYIDPNRVIRRQTYIESAPPTQMSAEPSAQMTSAQAFQAELAGFERQQNRRATAVEYKNLLMKYGVPIGNDFGPDISMK